MNSSSSHLPSLYMELDLRCFVMGDEIWLMVDVVAASFFDDTTFG